MKGFDHKMFERSKRNDHEVILNEKYFVPNEFLNIEIVI